MTATILTDSRRHVLPGIYTWMVENFTRVYFGVLFDHPKFCGPAGLKANEGILPVLSLELGADPTPHKFNLVTLNFGLNAIGKFFQDEEGFGAEMRFGGRPCEVYVPFEAIFTVYTPDEPRAPPFQFFLHPGQESLSIGSDKQAPLVSNGDGTPASVDQKPARDASHLRVVK